MSTSKKVPRPNEELIESLTEQIQFLVNDSKRYDEGDYFYAKRIALSLRVLLHDSMTSHSILQQINEKNIQYYNTTGALESKTNPSNRSLFYIDARWDKQTFEPTLNNIPPGSTLSKSNFDFWWNQIVLTVDNYQFSRKDLILKIANTDGGAHVDPSLDPDYSKLKEDNSLGIRSWSWGNEIFFENTSELAIIRQIAHEVLLTFKEKFPDVIEHTDFHF
jgi:hypothetical protein